MGAFCPEVTERDVVDNANKWQLATVSTLLVQLAGIVWWASGVQASVDRLQNLHSAVDHDRVEFYQRMTVVETKVDANRRILDRLEEKIDGMQ